MALTALELKALLTIDSSGFNQGLTKAETALNSLTGPMDSIVTGGISKLTSALAGFASEVVTAGMEFESKMSQVSAISGATGADLQALTDKAKEMGEKTVFSASQSADAFTYMAMAGWGTKDMLDGIAGIMMLAAASGEDLATTSDIVTDGLTAFGQGADQAGRLADIMAAASSSANTNVSLMGETFKYAAPVAGALGYSMEDTALAIGLMANAGIKGSQAGTSLRSILSRLSAPTGEVNAAMHTLGVSLTDEEGKMLSLRQVMQQLRKAFSSGYLTADEYNSRLQTINNSLADGTLKKSAYAQEQERLNNLLASGDITQAQYAQGMTDLDNKLAMGLISDTGTYEQALQDLAVAMWGANGATMAELASTIAGKNAMSGFLALVTASDEDFDALAAAIDNSAGAAESMANTMNNNLKGSLTLLDSALGTLKLTVYDTFSGTAKTAVDALTGAVSTFTGKLTEWLAQDSTQEKISKITEAVLGVVTAITENLDPILDGLVGIIEGVVTAAGFVVDHFDLIVKGIEAIIVAWGLLKAAQIGISVANAVSFIASNPIVALVAAVTGAIALIITNWDEVKTFVEGVWDDIKATAETVAIAVVGFCNLAKQTIESTWGKVKDFFGGVWDGIKEAFAGVGEWFGATFKAGYEAVQEAWKNLTSWFGAMWKGVQSALGKVDTWMGEKFGAAWDAIVNAFSLFISYFEVLWKTVKGIFSVVGDVLSGDFASAFEKIKEVLSGWGDFFSGLWTMITDAFANVGEWFYNIGDQIMKGIGNGIENAKNWVHEKVTSAVNSIGDWFRGLLGIASPSKVMRDQVGLMIGYGIAEGIVDSIGAVEDASTELVSAMPGSEYAMSVKRNFSDAYSGAMDSFAARMDDALNSFQQTIVLKLDNRELGRAVRGYV